MGSFCFLSSLQFSRISSPWAFLLTAVLAVCVPPLARAEIVVNEVYYDHPGTDTGYEFVEIFNPAPSPVVLDGVTLEFHNGSGAGWSVLWTGSALDTVPASGVFTVGADRVDPTPDVVIALSLQNGPDAVALFHAGVALDVVGYGALDDPEYVEGSGAAAVPAGRSIARIPDGIDTDDNHADFTAASPTPGRTNVARYDAALALSAGTPARDVLAGDVAYVALDVVNAGTQTIGSNDVVVVARDSTARDVRALGEWTNAGSIPPGRAETLAVPLALDATGHHWIVFAARYAGDERAHNDALTVLRRVGTPALIVSEVLSSPPADCPQFIEVYNAGGAPIPIGGYGLRDRSHDLVVVASGDATVDPGTFAVFTPDSSALESCFDVYPGRVFEVAATWPTINRTGGEVADSVVVADAQGLPVDAVAVPSVPAAAAGRSLERVDLYRGTARVTWVLSQESRGASPGRAGQRTLYAPPPPGTVMVQPNPFVPGEGVMTISVDVPGEARAVVSIFDPRGRRVAAVGIASSFPAVLVWNGHDDSGRDVLPGLYVLACEIVAGGETSVVKEVIGCARR